MVDVSNFQCTGCGACVAACPRHCISLDISLSGEYRPNIDIDKCTDCNLCNKVCFIENNSVKKQPIGDAFYGWCLGDEATECSSGGIASKVSEYVISQKGVVIGAYFDVNKGMVLHRVAKNKNDIFLFRGSKYVESNLSDIYTVIKKYIKTEKIVLFIGVPCQVLAIKNYLGDQYDNLITLEIFCHGVPRIGVFQKYLNYMRLKYGDLKSFNFRSKRFGWKVGSYNIKFKNKKIQEKHVDNIYHLMFGHHNSLRKSCFDCKCRGYNRSADISLGDFWGIDKFYPEVDTKKGVSAIFVNTKNGADIISAIKENIEIFNCKKEEILEKNKYFVENFQIPRNQDKFEKDFIYLPDKFFFSKYLFLYKFWFKLLRKLKI